MAIKSGTSNRGFASMDPEKQRAIASKGGKASHGGHASSASSKTHKSESKSGKSS